MRKDISVKTNQGTVEYWEHEVGEHNAAAEQKYASRIFNKEKKQHVFKIHASVKALNDYIVSLNLVAPVII